MPLPPQIVPPAQSRCVPWHNDAWASLQSLFQQQRLPHAMLLEGQPGTARNLLAITLARFLLCNERTAEGNCGACKTCTLSASGAHPDLLSVMPAEAGKAIGIDAVRQIIRFAAGTPSLGQHKVIVVTPAESLTSAAFNAFLKCLEEPSSDTFIVMVSAQGYPLPATIRSRCQRWPLTTPPLSICREWVQTALQDQQPAGADVDAMLHLCGGRPLDALAKLQGESCDTLLTLHGAVTKMMRDQQKSFALDQAIAAAEPDSVLDVLEVALQTWLRQLCATKLRSPEAQRGFQALNTLEGLRIAKRSGTNPNVDLLRFTASAALNGLWES